MKRLFAIIAATLGVALIVTPNIILGPELPASVIALNIVVCTLIFASSAWIFFVKWDRSDDKIGKWVGALGISIKGFSVYSVLALIAIFVMNMHALVNIFSDSYPVAFKYQLLVHCILLLFLVTTRLFSHVISDQVENVYVKEQAMVSGLNDMKSAAGRLQDAVFVCSEVSDDIKRTVDSIQQDIRYLSPVKVKEAKDIEEDFVKKVNALIPAFINYRLNEDAIVEQLRWLKHILENRKRIHN